MERSLPASACGRARAIPAVLVGLTLLLTSCAPEPTEPMPGYAGTPTFLGTPLTVTGDDGRDAVEAWAVEDNLVITTNGSGSCPWIPELMAIDDTTLRVSVAIDVPNVDGPCTADAAPRTFEIPAGRDLSDYAVEVTTRLDD